MGDSPVPRKCSLCFLGMACLASKETSAVQSTAVVRKARAEHQTICIWARNFATRQKRGVKKNEANKTGQMRRCLSVCAPRVCRSKDVSGFESLWSTLSETVAKSWHRPWRACGPRTCSTQREVCADVPTKHVVQAGLLSRSVVFLIQFAPSWFDVEREPTSSRPSLESVYCCFAFSLQFRLQDGARPGTAS